MVCSLMNLSRAVQLPTSIHPERSNLWDLQTCACCKQSNFFHQSLCPFSFKSLKIFPTIHPWTFLCYPSQGMPKTRRKSQTLILLPKTLHPSFTPASMDSMQYQVSITCTLFFFFFFYQQVLIVSFISFLSDQTSHLFHHFHFFLTSKPILYLLILLIF